MINIIKEISIRTILISETADPAISETGIAEKITKKQFDIYLFDIQIIYKTTF